MRSKLLQQCLSVALPSSCVLCGAPDDETLCAVCTARFLHQQKTRCSQCGNLLGKHLQESNPICGHCLKTPPDYDQTWIAADYEAPLDQLVLSFKFASRLALGPVFARLLRNAITQANTANDGLPDLIIPMPLASKRLIERGFNQALEIARPLAKMLDIPLASRLCTRGKETLPQTLLPLKERAKNVRNAFIVAPESHAVVKDKHIAIVDDVMTSGATLNALARELKRAGASRVSTLVVARALN